MNTLPINGVELACEERGEGELLVLVHGALGDFRSWEALVDELAAHYRVIAYSRRSHYPNLPGANGASYTIEAHAADLIAVLEQRGPAHLVGHSYGAAVCAIVAWQRPDLAPALVLAEPSLLSLLMSNPAYAQALARAIAVTPAVVEQLRQRKPVGALRQYLEIILGPRGFERLPPRARAVMIENLHTLEPMLTGITASRPFTVEHAASITAPTLLLDGEQSPALFRLVQDELARTLPNAQRITLPGVSHGLYLENPEAFSRAVLGYLSTLTMARLAR